MKTYLQTLGILHLACLAASAVSAASAAENVARLEELNSYWSEVARAVRAGDSEGYRATCHELGVLVSGIRKSSTPLTQALARWKQGFDETKAGLRQASVAFKFGQRLNDDTTAHETGMFHYVTTDDAGQRQESYIHFEALLLKQGRWRIMMEHQKSLGTRQEWQALPGEEISARQTHRIRESARLDKVSWRGLSVVDDQVAWVSGTQGMVGKSEDGGETWQFRRIEPLPEADFRSIHAFGKSKAVLANIGSPAHVLLTTDGGQTWRNVYTNAHPDAFIDGMDFWDEQEGIIYGDAIEGRMLLARTTDGGRSWVDPNQAPILKQGEASFAASDTGIRCRGGDEVVITTGGTMARLWRSVDRGERWVAIDTPTVRGKPTTGIYSLAVSGDLWIIVGGDHTRPDFAMGHHFFSEDGGMTWLAPVPASRGYRECVEFISPTEAICVGPTGVEVSTDSGRSWRPMDAAKGEGFHVVRRARRGQWVVLAGGEGRIAFLERALR